MCELGGDPDVAEFRERVISGEIPLGRVLDAITLALAVRRACGAKLLGAD